MAKFKMDGLDDLQKQLKRMEKTAKELGKTSSVPLSELLTPKFLRKYTNFSTVDELLQSGGFVAETTEEFDSIPQNELDAHVASATKFATWEDMLEEALAQYVQKKMGF